MTEVHMSPAPSSQPTMPQTPLSQPFTPTPSPPPSTNNTSPASPPIQPAITQQQIDDIHSGSDSPMPTQQSHTVTVTAPHVIMDTATAAAAAADPDATDDDESMEIHSNDIDAQNDDVTDDDGPPPLTNAPSPTHSGTSQTPLHQTHHQHQPAVRGTAAAIARRRRSTNASSRKTQLPTAYPGKLNLQSARTGAGKFYDYMRQQGVELKSVHEVSLEQLQKYLPEFIVSLRQVDGSYYSGNTIRSYIGGLQRELKTGDRFANVTFGDVPGVAEALLYVRQQQGVQRRVLHGQTQPMQAKHEALLTHVDSIVRCMYDGGADVNTDSVPIGFVTLVRFIAMLLKEFGMYKAEELNSLNITQFAVLEDALDKKRYISFMPMNRVPPTRASQLAAIRPAENITTPAACPVTILETYLIHRPLHCDSIMALTWMDEVPAGEQTWFTADALQTLTYTAIVRHIVMTFQTINVSVYNTTHVTVLADVSADEKQVMYVPPSPTASAAKRVKLESANDASAFVMARAVPHHSSNGMPAPVQAMAIDASAMYPLYTSGHQSPVPPLARSHGSHQLPQAHDMFEFMNVFQSNIDGLKIYVDACQKSLDQMRMLQWNGDNKMNGKPANKFV